MPKLPLPLLFLLAACVGEAGDLDDERDQITHELTAAARHRRAKAMYSSSIIARMYMPGHKTVGTRTAAQVAKVLERARPSGVSGLIRIDSNPNLDPQAAAFADFRAVRAAMPGVPFDVVLNACQYKGPDALIRQLTAINQKLGGMKPEAWFFDFYDTPLHDRKGDCEARGPNAKLMLRKVAEWAHRNDQLIGGNIWSAFDLPPDADFYAVPDEHGKQSTLELVGRLPTGVVRLVHVENNPQNCWVKGGDASTLDDPRNPTKPTCIGSGGDEYIWRMSPNERDRYDAFFLSAEQRANYAYMRPVFFPMSNHLAGAGGSQSFDREANAPPGALPFVAAP